MFQQQEAFSRVCLEVEDGWLLYWFQTTRMVPVIRGYGGQQRSAGAQCCKIAKLFRRVARPLRYSGKFFRQLRIISQIFDCDKSEVE